MREKVAAVAAQAPRVPQQSEGIPASSSSSTPLRLLVVEDCPADAELLVSKLEEAGFRLIHHRVASAAELVEALRSQSFDLVLADYGLPGWRGDEVIDVVRGHGLELPVVMVTGSLGDENAVEMIKRGAADFVLKERLARLPIAAHRALREKSIREERRHAQEQREKLVGDLQERIAELREKEKELSRLNRALHTTGQCNQALVRARAESDLLNQICHTIVETGGYRFAWVGYAEAGGELRPVAHAGHEAGYLRSVTARWDDAELARGPCGSAVRNRQPALVQDTARDLTAACCRDQAIQRGYNSILALPLLSGEKAIGCLNIYAQETGAFDAAEVELLSQLADNLAYGIAALRSRQQRERVEAQLRQAQKMEAVGRLAGGVAHDFNNLLSVILGFSDLLLERHAPDEELRKNLLEIRKAGERAAALTRHLLAFSRKQVLDSKVLDLNETTREMADMVRRMVGEDVQLEIIGGESLWRVRADPGQIGQVIMNLAANARDAMPRGGRLIIETANVELDGGYSLRHANCPPGQYVMLAVSDTGVGMNAENRSHAFEPFFSTKQIGQGTGLGLATVYGIVKQSGGYVWLYSEVGRGTTFKIYLPRTGAAPEAVVPPVRAPVLCGSETILVVEDETGVRDLMREYLRAQGYNVIQAANAEDVLSLLPQIAGEIALMITDVVMPGMSGPELAERVHQLSPETAVLYISGYTESTALQRGMLRSGSDFLQKPFRPAELARKAREMLDRSKSVPAAGQNSSAGGGRVQAGATG